MKITKIILAVLVSFLFACVVVICMAYGGAIMSAATINPAAESQCRTAALLPVQPHIVSRVAAFGIELEYCYVDVTMNGVTVTLSYYEYEEFMRLKQHSYGNISGE